MGILATIAAVILVVVGIIWILNGAWIAGLFAVIVGLAVGSWGGYGYYGRRRTTL